MRWGYLPVARNPISLVEVKRAPGVHQIKRLKAPLTVKEVHAILADKALASHVRMMIVLCVAQGLRISEVLGLKWEDVSFEDKKLSIVRSVVGSYVGDTKSESSRADVPLDDFVIHELRLYKELLPSINGWLFGNVQTGRPWHRDSLQADHLIPVGKRAGIPSLGWHTFRHTHIKFLRQVGAAPEVQMMLMRHSDMRTTNEYGRDGGDVEVTRPANQALVNVLLKGSESS